MVATLNNWDFSIQVDENRPAPVQRTSTVDIKSLLDELTYLPQRDRRVLELRSRGGADRAAPSRDDSQRSAIACANLWFAPCSATPPSSTNRNWRSRCSISPAARVSTESRTTAAYQSAG